MVRAFAPGFLHWSRRLGIGSPATGIDVVMDYKKIYDSLVERGINRTLDDYTEKHHIIPVCVGVKIFPKIL